MKIRNNLNQAKRSVLGNLGIAAIALFLLLSAWTAGGLYAQAASAPEVVENYIDVAIKQNPDILAARQRYVQADARVGQAYSALWPRIDINGNFTHFSGGYLITLPGVGTFSTASIAVIPWDNNVSATWNIFNYASFEAPKAASAYLSAAQSTVSASEMNIAYSVAESYYQYAKASELVNVRKAAVDVAKQNYASTEALLNAGKAAKNDVLRADVAVASSEGDVLSAQNDQHLAATQFNTLLKRDYDATIDPLTPQDLSAALNAADRDLASATVDNTPKETTTLGQDVDFAMKNRPDLAALNESRDALEGMRSVSVADDIPNISVFARYGWQEHTLSFATNQDYLMMGVQFRWNIFNGFATKDRVAENDAQIEELEFQKESAIDQVRMELQNARLDRENARDRRVIAQKQLASAEENHRITKAQYDLGLVPLITMIDAENTLTDARANLTTTTYDVLISEAKYRKALGLK